MVSGFNKSGQINFDYDGKMESFDDFLRSRQLTKKEYFNNIIKQDLTIHDNTQEENLKTVSKHADILRDYIIANYNLKDVLVKHEFSLELNKPEHLKFIDAAGHELFDRITEAVRKAVFLYWVTIWATKKIDKMSVEHVEEMMSILPDDAKKTKDTLIKSKISAINQSSDTKLVKFWEAIEKIKISFTTPIVPKISLSDLRVSHLNHVVQFDCVIIGPSTKKFNDETGKFVQKVLIQEPELEAKNNNPAIVKCILHGDDTNYVASGQKKRIVGTYEILEPVNGAKVSAEKTLIINTITTRDLEAREEVQLSPRELIIAKEFALSTPLKFENHMIQSFCPKIYGRQLEKMAFYLALLGGTSKPDYRNQSHLLLVGEADTGKSELERFSNQIANKSSIVDGSSATGVGILWALDEFDGTKILRAGKMILNSGGFLHVDEFDKMPQPEQKKLNSAMEQQRAIYDKGGHFGNAETKTTIIAVCNPHNERWDETAELIDNLPFGASTISRFDLLIRLKHEDTENQAREKMMHILRQKRGEKQVVAAPEYLEGLLNYQRNLKPVLTEEAEDLILNKFIEFQFTDQKDGSLPIETRQMEGIIRLCEARAKFLFKEIVDCSIVLWVIDFYLKCMFTIGMNVSRGVTQLTLRAQTVNQDEFFEEIFRELANEDEEEGNVVEHVLCEKLLENKRFFPTDRAVEKYLRTRQDKYFHEPRPGIFRKLRK